MRIFAFLLAALLAAPVFAQDKPPQIIIVPDVPEVPAPRPSAPTNGNYQKVLEGLQEITENVFNEDKWDTTTFRHRTTNKIKKWSDFTAYEKKIFCLMMSDQVYARLSYIDNAWKWELNKFKNPAYLPEMVKDEKDANNNTASKEDVEKWIEKLTDLRKDFAATVESKAQAIFKEYNEHIPAQDQEEYLKKIRERHEKDGLVKPPVEEEKDEVPSDG